MENREQAQNVFSKAVEKHFNAWKDGEKDKQLHEIPICAAGPGVGKSRLNQEGLLLLQKTIKNEKLKKYLDNAIQILVTFVNGTGIYNYEDSWKVETMICFRILYSYFNPNDKLLYSNWIRSKIPKKASLDLDITLSVICRDTKEYSCIYLGIDEFNVPLEKYPKSFSEFIQSLCNLMNTQTSYFLIPMISGLSQQEITKIISSSKNPPKQLPTPFLPIQSITNLMDNLEISSRTYPVSFIFLPKYLFNFFSLKKRINQLMY